MEEEAEAKQDEALKFQMEVAKREAEKAQKANPGVIVDPEDIMLSLRQEYFRGGADWVYIPHRGLGVMMAHGCKCDVSV